MEALETLDGDAISQDRDGDCVIRGRVSAPVFMEAIGDVITATAEFRKKRWAMAVRKEGEGVSSSRGSGWGAPFFGRAGQIANRPSPSLSPTLRARAADSLCSIWSHPDGRIGERVSCEATRHSRQFDRATRLILFVYKCKTLCVRCT